jgi:hypothetical protein
MGMKSDNEDGTGSGPENLLRGASEEHPPQARPAFCPDDDKASLQSTGRGHDRYGGDALLDQSLSVDTHPRHGRRHGVPRGPAQELLLP